MHERTSRVKCAHLDGVLVGEEVDDLERVRNNADGEELLAVVAAVHHHAALSETHRTRTVSISPYETTCIPHLSTKRSTMGICAFLNCFLA